MEILFLILKIAGILVGGILGIIFLLILAVVVIPVRYRISGKAEDFDSIEGGLVLSWFLHLVHIKADYTKGTGSLVIRIFGIPFVPGREKKAKPPKRFKSKKQKIKREKKTAAQCKKLPIEENACNSKAEEQELITETTKQEANQNKNSRVEPLAQNAQRGTKKRKNRFKEWIMALGELYNRFKEFIKQLKNGTITVKGQIERLKRILSKEDHKKAFGRLLKECSCLWRHFAPRQAVGTLLLGMGSPDLTGQVLGIISLLPFLHRYKITVEPDFLTDSPYIKGSLRAFGHIRALHMLISGFRLIKDKNIRRLINQIRN